MGLSQLEICNQALLKVGADVIDTLTPPASTEDGTKRSIELCNIFFDQAYEEVLRMYPWNSAKKRTVLTLSELSQTPDTITVDGADTSDINQTYTRVSDYNGRARWQGVTDDGVYLVWNDLTETWEFDQSFIGSWYTVQSNATLPPKFGWEVNDDLGDSGTLPAPSLNYYAGFGYDRYSQLPSDLIRLVDIFRSEDQRDERTSWVVEGGYILSDYETLYMKYIAKPSSTTELEPLCTNALICNLAMKLCTSLQLDDAWAKRINDELYGIILPQARSIDTLENKELLLEESSWLLNRNYDYPV